MYLELVSDRRQRRRRRILLTWLAAAGTCGYLLPWAVATTRGKAGADVLGLANLVLGWTVVGWLVVFVLACRRHGIAGLRVTGLG
ncbi:superinfection immunity protein [Nocardioides caeni]|uniref:Superinfection immunity protein n=1 Tax=Nocardioides caeni TaxID=574700 RepID=A0A4S8NHC5_9ACTN|nr:superinfection immunity protein [Nocardioides caeni]THV16153.1 superinfection immunity protein [Nocardioides caeni]